MLKLPEVYGVSEARAEISRILEGIGRGETFIIKGSKGREAFVMNADYFRRLQEVYADLIGEIETAKILRDEEAVSAIEAAMEGTAGGSFTLSEVEGMVEEDGS